MAISQHNSRLLRNDHHLFSAAAACSRGGSMSTACLGVFGGREAPVRIPSRGRYRAVATKSSMTKLHVRSLPVKGHATASPTQVKAPMSNDAGSPLIAPQGDHRDGTHVRCRDGLVAVCAIAIAQRAEGVTPRPDGASD